MEDEAIETFIKDECADYLSDIPSEFGDSESDVSDCDTEDSLVQVPRIAPVFHVSVPKREEEENEQDIELDWSDVDPPRKNEAFEGSMGPNIFPTNENNIEEIVSMFVGDDLLEFIALQTNKYRAENSSGKTAKWFDLTVGELKKWFALVIVMGLIRKSRINDYWSLNPLIETPIFSKTMSRDRFRQILTFLHFSDNESMPQNADRLFKVQRIIDYFSKKFRDNFHPGQNVSIEESVIPWRGKFSLRIHNPNKTTKHGILIKMLCDSTTGYISSFKLYSNGEQKSDNSTMELLEHCSGKWHHLYTDSSYDSVELARNLLFRKIRFCGTIGRARVLPEALKRSNLKMAESMHRRKGEVLIQLWKITGKKEMRMISTIHNADVIDTGRIDRRTGRPIQKPRCVIDYNRYKGVDRADQFLNYYPLYRKTKKWTKKVVLYLINCGLFNAFKVYERLNVDSVRRIKYHDFLLLVAKSWIEDNIPDAKENVKIPTTSRVARFDSIQRLSGDLKQHQLVKISETGKRKRKRCRVCYANKIRKDTYLMCKFCKVPLHLGECFASYHLKKNY